MQRLLASCGGFLLAVLWMDLMFDVQVWGVSAQAASEETIAAIAAYYRRVTIDADPMRYLIGSVMGVTLVGSLHQLLRGRFAAWLRVVAFLCASVPVGLALLRIVPNAMELGRRTGTLEQQALLARSILRDHVLCTFLIVTFIVIELTAHRASGPAARPNAG